VCVCVKDEVAGVRRASGVHHRALPGRRLLRHSRMSSSPSALSFSFLFQISGLLLTRSYIWKFSGMCNLFQGNIQAPFTLFHIIQKIFQSIFV